jgi:hypothetical protein
MKYEKCELTKKEISIIEKTKKNCWAVDVTDEMRKVYFGTKIRNLGFVKVCDYCSNPASRFIDMGHDDYFDVCSDECVEYGVGNNKTHSLETWQAYKKTKESQKPTFEEVAKFNGEFHMPDQSWMGDDAEDGTEGRAYED